LAYFWCLKSWMFDNYQVPLRLGSTKTFWWTGDCISFLFVPSSTCGKFDAWPLAQSSLSASMGLSLKICHIGILGFTVNRWLLSFQSDLPRTRSRLEKCLSYAGWALEFFLHWFHNSFSWMTNFSPGCFEFHRWLDRSALCSNQEQPALSCHDIDLDIEASCQHHRLRHSWTNLGHREAWLFPQDLSLIFIEWFIIDFVIKLLNLSSQRLACPGTFWRLAEGDLALKSSSSWNLCSARDHRYK